MDSPQRRVRVVIVDDDALVRAALRLVLEGDSGVTVLGEGADGRSGYDAARSLRPDVVLMDLHMPGTDGVWATAQIAADCPDTKVLVLTAFDTDAMVAAALRAGATGFLLKDSAPEIIFRAVHAAADGQRAFSGSVLDRLVEAAVEATPQRRAFPETVTDRERQVARQMSIADTTVKTHVSALLDKFGVSNRVQLAVAVAECAEAAL